MKRVNTLYFDNNEDYFNFINKNKDRKIIKLGVVMMNNKIKVVYQFQ